MMTYVKFICVSFFLLLIINHIPSSVFLCANDEVNTTIRGIDNSRMTIFSGVFTLTGTTVEYLNEKEQRRFDDDCYVAFDYNQGFYRFDRRGEGKVLLNQEGIFERLKNAPGGNQATVKHHDFTHRPNVNINPFDVRAIGLFSSVGSYYDFKYENFRPFLLKKTKVIEEKNDRLAYISVINSDASEDANDAFPIFQFWLDKNNGYTTTRIEIGSYHTSDITWKEINNVFVPVTLKQRYNGSSGLRSDIDWVLTWEIVNDVIPKELFTYQALKDDSDDYGVLYSTKLGNDNKPVAIDVFGRGDYDVPVTRQPNMITFIFMYAGIVLMLIGVCKMLYDRWKRNA